MLERRGQIMLRTMRILTSVLLSASLVLAACGGKAKPAPTPAPTETADTCGVQSSNGVPTNAEQCECLGHQVVGDIGNGQVACPDGTTEVAKIQYGIEGGVCCQAATAPAGE